MNLKLVVSQPAGYPPSSRSGSRKKLKGANHSGRLLRMTSGEVIAIRIIAGRPSHVGSAACNPSSLHHNHFHASFTHGGTLSSSSFSSVSLFLSFSSGGNRYPSP